MESVLPSVSPKQLKSLLVNYFKLPTLPNGRRRRPLRVVSSPGMGKTEIAYQSGEAVALPVFELRLVQHETVDITGAIGIDQATQTASWYPFEEMYPTDPKWEGVIYLGETGQLDTSMQKIIMGMLDRGGIAGRRIPAGARFLMDGNRQHDRASSTRLLTPIENRSLSVELKFSLDDWIAWAAAKDIHHVVQSYAEFVGADEFVPKFNPAEEIHATPRSWAAVSDELQARPGSDGSAENAEVRTVVHGLVGPGPVAQFMAFREHFHLLHGTVDKVFDEPEEINTDSLERSAQHALVGAIASRLKERNGSTTDQQMQNITTFANRGLSKTLQTLLILHCDRATAGTEHWKQSAGRKKWLAANADLITGAIR
jgi:hypothetical protein